MTRNAVLNEVIEMLEEQVLIYSSSKFSYPNGCINSVLTTKTNIAKIENMKEQEND